MNKRHAWPQGSWAAAESKICNNKEAHKQIRELWDDNSKKGQILILKLKKCTFFGKETKNEHDQKARSTARQQLKERFATTKRHTQTN